MCVYIYIYTNRDAIKSRSFSTWASGPLQPEKHGVRTKLVRRPAEAMALSLKARVQGARALGANVDPETSIIPSLKNIIYLK